MFYSQTTQNHKLTQPFILHSCNDKVCVSYTVCSRYYGKCRDVDSKNGNVLCLCVQVRFDFVVEEYTDIKLQSEYNYRKYFYVYVLGGCIKIKILHRNRQKIQIINSVGGRPSRVLLYITFFIPYIGSKTKTIHSQLKLEFTLKGKRIKKTIILFDDDI